MQREKPRPQFELEINGTTFRLREAEFNGVLFDVVSCLVFEKQVDRASYLLQVGERELMGSGGEHFDPFCVSLYRHLKEKRCHGPAYEELGGQAESFRLHSIVDGLVAVDFYLKAGATVPHFMVGRPEKDLVTVLDRGGRFRLDADDAELLSRLTRLVPR